MVICAVHPGLAVSAVLFAISGALAISYQMQVGALFIRILPDHSRAQGMGVMSSALITVQGLGIVAGGVVADATDPASAVALAGLAGILLGARSAWVWTTTRPAPWSSRSDGGADPAAVPGVHRSSGQRSRR
jgi:hypothetical protein